ncbi:MULTISPECIES: ABC transporter ATP-binding protein [Mesorhizobium]|uniref:ABC transporter ATP-binding protein n=1 Tax=Mesorhizobium denitrificans TaxID=2294114 RepID=A0A371XK71_9HYPH|nr:MULTISPECIES: ABC transporter ATP-binding protein [Mesorhizobium]RFC69625.1 ABC transporter ATP-binding protein [Mesorhizobium denitrificans]
MKPLLIARNLSRNFGGLKAVDMVDFSVNPGEVRAVIGPNGAGKTTLVSLLCGRIEPSSGVIGFNGEDITRVPAHIRVRMGIAYTFQITSIFPNLTVYDNVALAAQRTLTDGRSRKALDASVRDAMLHVGLTERASTPAAALSYGHQRLLEIAMGLALHPRLLILDEPTQGLSDGEIKDFIKLVRDIRKETTVLLIEHNMDVVMRLADRITVMENGRILAEGAPRSIRANAKVQQAYLGTADG